MKVVALGEPLKLTVELAIKLEPLTVIINPEEPLVVEVGEIDVKVGAGLPTVMVGEEEIVVKVPESETRD